MPALAATAAITMKKLTLSMELQKLPSQPATKLPMKLVPSHSPIIVEIMRAGAIFETSDKPMGRSSAARRGQGARLFREVPESGLYDGNRSLARTLRRSHRIHHPPPAQRRLIERGEQPRLAARSTFWRRDESGSKRRADLL
jgi:hypothetical protein